MKAIPLLASVWLFCPAMAKQETSQRSDPPAAAEAKTKTTEPAAPPPNPVNKARPQAKESRVAAVSSIEPEALDGFHQYAPQLQQLVRDALALTKLNLTYTFGSSDPKQGGMDCSGTIFHLLTSLGIKNVPRQSDQMCAWVQDHTLLRLTPTADSLKHPELAALQPGDLLFWSGTYAAAPRNTPVTHVMLYLGQLKKNAKPVVFGASDGRVYQGDRRTGVSVFDFTMPAAGKSRLHGYGLIPGVGKITAKAPEPAPPAAMPEASKPVTAPGSQHPDAGASAKSAAAPAKAANKPKSPP